jgi:hypothetical protein
MQTIGNRPGNPIKGKIPSLYMQRLWPTIAAMSRGDTLTDETILAVVPELRTHQAGARHLDGLIRKWTMRERGIEVQRRNNAGYYLLTDIEQAKTPKRSAERARKTYGRGLKAGHGVDPRNLPDDEQRKLEHTMRIVATQLQIATEAVGRIRLEMGEGNLVEKRLGRGAK